MANQRPLWWHLGVKVFPLALTVLLAMASILFLYTYNVDRQLARENYALRNETLADSVMQYLNSIVGEVTSISKNSLVVNSLIDFSGRDNYLPAYLESIGIFGRTDISIQLVDFAGNYISGNYLSKSLTFPNKNIWGKQVLREGNQWTRLDANGFMIAQPVYNRSFPEGALLVHVELGTLAIGLKSVTNNQEFFILDSLGDIIYSSDESGTAADQNSTLENLTSTTDNIVRLPNFQISTKVASDIEEAKWYQSKFTSLVLTTISIFLLSAFLIVFYTTKHMNRMLSRLSDALVRTSQSGVLIQRVETSNSAKELAILGDQFNKMMENLYHTTTTRDEVSAILNSINHKIIVCNKNMEVVYQNETKEFNNSTSVSLKEKLHLPEGHLFLNENNSVKNHIQEEGNQTFLWNKEKFVLGDEPQGWVFVATDITDVRTAQSRMQILMQAVDCASIGIVISDASKPNFPTIFVNTAFSSITGYAFDDTLNRNLISVLDSKSQKIESQIMAQAYRTAKPTELEVKTNRKNGDSFVGHFTINPVVNDQGNTSHYLTVIQDVTSVVQAQQELKLAKESAEVAAKAKTDFLATMSHEIRTPMNGVIGMLDLLLTSELTKTQVQKARIAQNSAKSLLTIINDILDFSKIDAGKLVLDNNDFNLLELIEETTLSLAYLAHKKGLEITLDTVAITEPMVSGDAGRLRQVLTNLMGNAIKFTEHGGIQVQFNLLNQEGSFWLQGTVSDTGIGISAEDQENIFDVFTQADSSTTKRFGGTGLGLSVVKKLCQIMGGDIRLTSILDCGSEFTFHIKLDKAKTKFQTANSSSFVKKKALVIDENALTSSVLIRLLNALGLQVEMASNEADARLFLTKNQTDIASEQLDLIIIDSKTAISYSKTFKDLISRVTETQRTKTIVTAPIGAEGLEDFLSRYSFSSILAKPITSSNLITTLGYLFNQHQEKADETNTPSKPVTTRPESTGSAAKNILVVEDNEINQLVALGILEQHQYIVEVANNGKEALELLQTKAQAGHPFKAILMDCQMPIMDGFEATRILRKRSEYKALQNTPIIAMTANAMDGDRERCLEAGMNDYVTKPIDEAVLLSAIDRWTSNRP